MYNVATIKSSFLPLIGWRQNHDPSGTQLGTSLLTSESGMYYQDEHPVLTLENLLSITPDFTLITYPFWSISTDYVINNIVKKGIIIYRAIKDGVGHDPEETDSLYWIEENPFTTWLKEKTEGAIIRAIEYWLETKQQNRAAKSILENKVLFDSTGVISNTKSNSSRLVGMELNVKRNIGSLTKLGKVGLQFTAPVSLTLYLYHSSSNDAIESKSINYSKTGTEEWFDLNFDLPYLGDFVGGSFYIVYKQSELGSVEAISRVLDYSVNEQGLYDTTGLWSAFLSVHPFNVPESTNLWDIKTNQYDYSENYGLNFTISAYCDYTGFLTEQRDVFKNIIAKQVAVNLLREIAYNPNGRVARTESVVSRQQLLYEIDGSLETESNGLAKKLEQAAKAVNIVTDGINKLCLPCTKKGVRYRTI